MWRSSLGARLSEARRFPITGLLLLCGALPLLTGCMSLPEGLNVYESDSGCTSGGEFCWGYPQNFYYPPTRQVVVLPNQGESTIMHEVCHAHQHEVVLEELGREPSMDLHEWYDTSEAQSFAAAIAGEANPWQFGGDSLLEDFANTCAMRYAYASWLESRAPQRLQWALDHLSD